MRQVAKGEFYGPIYADRLNVSPHIQSGPYPYTSIWKYVQQPWRTYGKTVDQIERGVVTKSYYVAE